MQSVTRAFYMIGGTDEIADKAEKMRVEQERLAKIQAERDAREAEKEKQKAVA